MSLDPAVITELAALCGVGADSDEAARTKISVGLTELLGRAQAAWPGLQVTDTRLATELLQRLRRGPVVAIAALHHDVVLAIAAGDRDPQAAAAVEQIASREVTFAAARLRAGPSVADDIRSELRRLLFTSDGERPAALATFSGRGDLRGYLRVMAARAVARHLQKDRKQATFDDDFADVLSPALDPDVALMREQYQREVDAAFRHALTELTDRERAVLRFHLLDGWSIDQIGDRYRVHRATAARWVSAARDNLGQRIRARLAEQLNIDPDQVDSIVALVTSRVEASLDRLLAVDPRS